MKPIIAHFLQFGQKKLSFYFGASEPGKLQEVLQFLQGLFLALQNPISVKIWNKKMLETE